MRKLRRSAGPDQADSRNTGGGGKHPTGNGQHRRKARYTERRTAAKGVEHRAAAPSQGFEDCIHGAEFTLLVT